MTRPIPFLFCRYELSVGDEVLDGAGQFEALSELQGKYYPHGPKAEREGKHDSAIMRPRTEDLDGDKVIFWSVGQQVGVRLEALYDDAADDLTKHFVQDDGVRYTDFVALPRLSVLVVDDRASDLHLGGRRAISRFRSVFRQLGLEQNSPEAEANVILETSQADLERALEQWGVTSFGFTVRPYNPHGRGPFAKKLSEAMERRNVNKMMTNWEASSRKKMKLKGDPIVKGAMQLTEDGYGQVYLKGSTPDGRQAHIKKPTFSLDRKQNLKALSKPREMRVYFDPEDKEEEEIFMDVAKTLRQVYDEE